MYTFEKPNLLINTHNKRVSQTLRHYETEAMKNLLKKNKNAQLHNLLLPVRSDRNYAKLQKNCDEELKVLSPVANFDVKL